MGVSLRSDFGRYVMQDVTKVFIGASALASNGAVIAHAGTALVAMVAKTQGIPVLVCAETYKFCERVQVRIVLLVTLTDASKVFRLLPKINVLFCSVMFSPLFQVDAIVENELSDVDQLVFDPDADSGDSHDVQRDAMASIIGWGLHACALLKLEDNRVHFRLSLDPLQTAAPTVDFETLPQCHVGGEIHSPAWRSCINLLRTECPWTHLRSNTRRVCHRAGHRGGNYSSHQRSSNYSRDKGPPKCC